MQYESGRIRMSLFNRRQKRRGILLEQPLDNGEQCSRCNADCCRGFPSVELTEAEYDRLEKVGDARLEFTLNGHFYLIIENGCDYLRGNRCGIYEQRPEICRRFTCQEL